MSTSTTHHPQATVRFLDLGEAEGASRALNEHQVAPDELLACELFYDPSELDMASALSLLGELDPQGTLPTSAVPARLSASGVGRTRLQATAAGPGVRPRRSGDGRWSTDGTVLATKFVDAPGEDIVRQSRAVLEELKAILLAEDLSFDDVAKFNIFYRGDGTKANWAENARVRAEYFSEPGPAATGIPLPTFEDEDTLIAMQVLAVRGVRPDRRHSWPANHWDWTFHVPYKHGNRFGSTALLGGQVSLDSSARVLHPDDFAAQVRTSYDYIDRILQDLDVPRTSVQRLTAFIAASEDEAATRVAAVRAGTDQFFGDAAPALVPIVVPYLAYPDVNVEIELQASVG